MPLPLRCYCWLDYHSGHEDKARRKKRCLWVGYRRAVGPFPVSTLLGQFPSQPICIILYNVFDSCNYFTYLFIYLLVKKNKPKQNINDFCQSLTVYLSKIAVNHLATNSYVPSTWEVFNTHLLHRFKIKFYSWRKISFHSDNLVLIFRPKACSFSLSLFQPCKYDAFQHCWKVQLRLGHLPAKR